MAVDRKQQMKEITERLEQGVKDIFTSEMYTTYLRTMAKFHNYSFNNTLLIPTNSKSGNLVSVTLLQSQRQERPHFTMWTKNHW